MKISFCAITAATFVGSTSAMGITFEPPIMFTQYDEYCDGGGNELYHGSINSVSMLGKGEFCVVDNVPSAEDPSVTEFAYSKLAIHSCQPDRVVDLWYKCTDDTCEDCQIEYRSYTSYDSHNPDDVMQMCYTYHFSMDSHDTVTEQRNMPLGITPGDFKSIATISYNFDWDTNPDDARAYLDFIKDNSCIRYGNPIAIEVPKEPFQPPKPNISKNNNNNGNQAPNEPVVVMTESSSNVVKVSTAALVVTLLASSMMFV